MVRCNVKKGTIARLKALAASTVILGAFGAAFCCTSAYAILGSSESSLTRVKQLISPSSERVTSYSTHRVHEYSVIRGIIRAYVSNAGQVFAYTGHNQMGLPPVALLGPYKKEYEDAVRAFHKSGGRRPLQISTEHVRAGISGPQGELSWYLILQNLPSGVSRDEIR